MLSIEEAKDIAVEEELRLCVFINNTKIKVLKTDYRWCIYTDIFFYCDAKFKKTAVYNWSKPFKCIAIYCTSYWRLYDVPIKIKTDTFIGTRDDCLIDSLNLETSTCAVKFLSEGETEKIVEKESLKITEK